MLIGGLPLVAVADPDPLSLPPKSWATEVAANEVNVIEYNGVYLRYRMHLNGAKGDMVRDVIESKDGTVARLILKENRPLTPDEDQAEHTRLEDMLNSPAAFQKHVKGDQSGKKLAVDLIKLMPDAMIYTYTPGQPQREHAGAGQLEIVLDFHPNPAWNPPTTASEGLTGLEGRMWVDRRTHHLTRMEGNIFRPVNLGFGMLAHIFPGGHLMLEQTAATSGAAQGKDQRWIFSHFVEHITLRALMVKNIAENSEIESSNYQQVEPMSYQDAIKTLLATPLPGK